VANYKQALLMLAGDRPGSKAGARLQALAAAEQTLLVAADGGAQSFAHFGLSPHIILGDGDSLQPDLFPATKRIRYPEKKTLLTDKLP
jgi:thiamine pyrophosphokinase